MPIFPNLYRNVIPARPDVVWVGDITYIRLATGFCYLAVLLDACSRKVVGYAISRQIDTQLVLAALKAAVRCRRPTPGLICHSDRGAQYASEMYRRALKEFGLQGSMSSPGNPYHNAQAESFMKTVKVEEVNAAGYDSFEEASPRRSTTPGACTRRWDTCHPTSSKPTWPGGRLSLDEPRSPAGVRSTSGSVSGRRQHNSVATDDPL